MPAETMEFQQDPPAQGDYDAFIVDLEGFEGPLDLLLALSRQQKVDLRHLSILRLAEQYIHYIERARQIHLEVAADYLVMAAWLAYLKSRLLLPEPETDEEPSGEELAARLQHQLLRLQAMRERADALMARDRLGLDVFARGDPEAVQIAKKTTIECTLFDILSAYTAPINKRGQQNYVRPVPRTYAIEAAFERLTRLLGDMPAWTDLMHFLPRGLRDPVGQRSEVASTFAACLEMAKQGQVSLRQLAQFGPIYLKSESQS